MIGNGAQKFGTQAEVGELHGNSVRQPGRPGAAIESDERKAAVEVDLQLARRLRLVDELIEDDDDVLRDDGSDRKSVV